MKNAEKRAVAARKAAEVAAQKAEAMALQKAVAIAAKEAAKEAAREAAREAAQAAKAAKKASNKETSSLTTAEREELAATRESLAMVLKSLEALTSQRASRELHQVVLADSPVVSQKPKGRNTRNSQKAQSSSQLQRLDSIMIKSYFSNFRQQRCPPGGNGHC